MLTVVSNPVKIPKGYPQMVLDFLVHRMNDDRLYLQDKTLKNCPNVARLTSDEGLLYLRKTGKPDSYLEYFMNGLNKLLELNAVKHLGSKYYMVSPFFYAKYDMKYHQKMQDYYARIESKKSYETI